MKTDSVFCLNATMLSFNRKYSQSAGKYKWRVTFSRTNQNVTACHETSLQQKVYDKYCKLNRTKNRRQRVYIYNNNKEICGWELQFKLKKNIACKLYGFDSRPVNKTSFVWEMMENTNEWSAIKFTLGGGIDGKLVRTNDKPAQK